MQLIIEPAIERLRASEMRQGSEEECFKTAAGVHLRFRCCVYFTTLAAGLLEQHYMLPQSLETVRYATAAGSGAMVKEIEQQRQQQRGVPSHYGAMARWLLPPPPDAPAAAHALAEEFMATAENASPSPGSGSGGSGGESSGYSLVRMRAAASRLPGPVGRYAAALRVGGVHGTLWRCEISTVHTYLVFSAAGVEDILIDVTYKQFLVLPEWMEARHFQAALAANLFAELPDAFVGRVGELDQLMTLPALESAMRLAYAGAGDDAEERLEQQGKAMSLSEMHTLRSEALFGLRDSRRRSLMCGKPAQHQQQLHELQQAAAQAQAPPPAAVLPV